MQNTINVFKHDLTYAFFNEYLKKFLEHHNLKINLEEINSLIKSQK